MASHPLDNPAYDSLAHRHRALARSAGEVLRYPSDIAPFLGVPRDGLDDPGALAALVPEGDTALVIGPHPVVPTGFVLEPQFTLVQMVCPAPLAETPGPEIVELGPERHEQLLELVALVYPHYFRPRAMAMGRYFGMFHGDQLVAIAGERMGPPGHREVSAICTHPEHLGRGHARRLTAYLCNRLLDEGLAPFLHVSPSNTRALGLYEAMGFQHRAGLRFSALRRA
ncbi:GNAT family N-acetyltransferase [Arenimonas caeni]|jgi:ribosomal protein S18 acetylase RimI-like enzyme|uniref:GNAT family N-acetyltransferase n=1 Tax=Arenimonas caeni TaxID=2058085 RepID=UPI002A363DFE|nr:GNAT family N-acetyltransferase [Arenimonas caeni]MDY0021900.1 GNAT family N-acetyltransferase [Arenimonas caeni]